MRINEFIVDPVAAALRKLVKAELTRGEHDLARRAVDFVAINVDIGKVVVGSNLLNLAQRVLQCFHIPQADVLQSGLVVGGIGGADSGLGGEFALGEFVETVGLAGHFDVMSDVRLFAHQFVRLDQETAHVPPDDAHDDITNGGRGDGGNEPAPTWFECGACKSNCRSQQKGPGNNQHAGEGDVRVSVGDAFKNGVVFKQEVEPADVHMQREDEQQDSDCNGRGSPWDLDGAAEMAAEGPRAPGDDDEQDGENADQNGQRKQPADDGVPCGQRK